MICLQFILGVALNIPCLILPYRLRVYYIRLIAFLFHAPFFIFGKIALYLFKKLNIDPRDL